MPAKFRSFGVDLFPFLAVVVMAAAVLVVALVANLLAVLGSPDHILITSIIRSSDAGALAGAAKQPSRVEVYRDHLVIYPDEVIVAMRDMDGEGDAFGRLLNDVSADKDSRYILLMARPGSATVVNLLKKRIRARGVDVGCELYEAGRPAGFERLAGTAVPKRTVR